MAEQGFAIDQLNAEENRKVQESLITLAQNEADRAAELRPIEDEILQLTLDNLKKAGEPTQEQLLLQEMLQLQIDDYEGSAPLRQQIKDLTSANLAGIADLATTIEGGIRTQAESVIGEGLSDIEDQVIQLGRSLGEELAPGLGLRPTDAPIIDRGGRVLEQAVRQGGQLVRRVRGSEATALAGIPLQIAGLTGDLLAQASAAEVGAAGAATGTAGTGGGLGLSGTSLAVQGGANLSGLLESSQQFQQELQQRAFQNRLALSGSGAGNIFAAGGFGGQLATGINAGIPQALSSLQGLRLGGAGTTSTTKRGASFLDIIGGIGQLFGGAGEGAAALAMLSSKEYKTDKTGISFLDNILNVPVEHWRYKWEDGTYHVGPYAEDFNKTYNVGQTHPDRIAIQDLMGVTLGTLRDLTMAVLGMRRELDQANATT